MSKAQTTTANTDKRMSLREKARIESILSRRQIDYLLETQKPGSINARIIHSLFVRERADLRLRWLAEN